MARVTGTGPSSVRLIVICSANKVRKHHSSADTDKCTINRKQVELIDAQTLLTLLLNHTLAKHYEYSNGIINLNKYIVCIRDHKPYMAYAIL